MVGTQETKPGLLWVGDEIYTQVLMFAHRVLLGTEPSPASDGICKEADRAQVMRDKEDTVKSSEHV